jgi:3-hydroxypropanoate dehydrogenase
MPGRGALDDRALDLIFRKARTQNSFDPTPLPEQLLHQVYDLMKWGPTSANCSPARFVFVASKDAKERLKPALSANNRDKTMAAPCTVIVAYDTKFYELLPELFPHNQTARSWFEGNEALAQETAFRNSSLQGAYFIVAARSLGLDCGPMSGFDQAKVNAEFFPDGRIKSNFLVNLGYGDDQNMFARSPRLSFERTCQVL